MDFSISKKGTLPLLKVELTKDGVTMFTDFMNDLERATIFFSMNDVATGTKKVVNLDKMMVIFLEHDGKILVCSAVSKNMFCRNMPDEQSNNEQQKKFVRCVFVR